MKNPIRSLYLSLKKLKKCPEFPYFLYGAIIAIITGLLNIFLGVPIIIGLVVGIIFSVSLILITYLTDGVFKNMDKEKRKAKIKTGIMNTLAFILILSGVMAFLYKFHRRGIGYNGFNHFLISLLITFLAFFIWHKIIKRLLNKWL